MPVPPEAFSALATTKSRASRLISSGSAFLTMPTPGVPTMSPMNRIRIRLQIRNPTYIHRVHRFHRFKVKSVKSVKSVDEFKSGSVCDFDRARFAHDGHFDFARVVQLLLDGAGDFAAGLGRFAVGQLMRVGDDAELAAGLDRKGVLDAREAG